MASVQGGEQLKIVLGTMARDMASGQVRVGFLEESMYPTEDASRVEDFLKGVAKFSAAKKPGSKAAMPAPQLRLPLSKGPLSVAQVAFWDNFGTSTSPPRPFFTKTIEDNKGTWGEDLGKIAVATGYNSEETLRLMGERIRDQIVKSIVDWPADNAELTVAIKGFNKGLIHSGVMQRAVNFEVQSG